MVDGHVDLPYFMASRAPESAFTTLKGGPFTLETAQQAGVRLFFTALYCEDAFNGETSVRRFEEIFSYALAHLDGIVFVKGIGDLEAVERSDDRLGALLLLENADSLADNPGLVREMKGRGIRIVGLTHAGSNRLGDGNAVSVSKGFTPAGREAVRLLEDQRLLIDVAHLHPTCFWQLLDLCEGPIINSHTGIRSIFDTPRNIDLSQAGEIISRGGVIGITFNAEMLSPEKEARVEQVFRHLDAVVQKFGTGGVGIGSDLCGFEAADGEDAASIAWVAPLMALLSGHGYAEADVRAIMGGNWMRLLKANLSSH